MAGIIMTICCPLVDPPLVVCGMGCEIFTLGWKHWPIRNCGMTSLRSSACMFVCPIACLSVPLYACLSRCMFVYPIVCLSVPLYVCLSHCMSFVSSIASRRERFVSSNCTARSARLDDLSSSPIMSSSPLVCSSRILKFKSKIIFWFLRNTLK